MIIIIAAFPPLGGSNTGEDTSEDKTTTNETQAEMGIGMAPSEPAPLPSTAPPTTGPGDLVAPPSPDDPDFCLKESGQMQMTGGKPSPQCTPGQGGVVPPPTESRQHQPVTPNSESSTSGWAGSKSRDSIPTRSGRAV